MRTRETNARARRAAGRCAVKETSDPRPDRRPRRWQTASRDGRFNLGRFAPEAEPGSPATRRPAGHAAGGAGEAGGVCVWGRVSLGFRWGWGVFTRRMAVGANEKRPRPPPRSTQDINASWSGLGITPRVICHSLPSAEPLRLRVHPLPLAPLSRPSRVRSLVEDLLEWPSPPSHCHLHHLTAISTISLPSHCHLHPVAVRSLPHLLYHTRGGGGSGISCASLSSSASGSVVERRSQRSIADALDRKEIGRALRCSAQIDCPVRALK
jgi:hypothetical protein